MPNGKPGDHPLTDIVVHGMTVFGDPVDGLIRDAHDAGALRGRIANEWLYERYWGYRDTLQRGGEADVARTVDQLADVLRDEIARTRGDA
jgi:hypothetical protein